MHNTISKMFAICSYLSYALGILQNEPMLVVAGGIFSVGYALCRKGPDDG